MDNILLKKDVLIDIDNSITCPVCKSNQIIHTKGSQEKNKIILKFDCINCNKKDMKLIFHTDDKYNTTEMFWSYDDCGFYKIYFE